MQTNWIRSLVIIGLTVGSADTVPTLIAARRCDKD